jgi:hypothetical protein
MTNITINHVELASELAHIEVIRYHSSGRELYVVDDNGDERYADDIQDLFNDLYDMYYELILIAQIQQQ